MTNIQNSRFLCALRGEKTDTTPIWLMRQAGRYMQVYRTLREKYDLLTMVKTPELAAEVTMQPINAFELDAAIIFSDILPLLEGLGLRVRFLPGEGPCIENPIKTPEDIANLKSTPAEESMSFTLEAIKQVRPQLASKNIPLIGFSGAPFTLASYSIEGGGSKDFLNTKKFMLTEPKAFHLLMSKLSEAIGEYLLAQAAAGAQALQIFDSWAGHVSAKTYVEWIVPHTKRVIEIAKRAKVPVIYFSTGTGTFLSEMHVLDADVLSVDWRCNLVEASHVQGIQAVQGNLDPATLFAPWEVLKHEATHVLKQAKTIPKGYVFNLGHGVLQHTPEDNVKRLVDFVHEYA